jgi:hypothetical protein
VILKRNVFGSVRHVDRPGKIDRRRNRLPRWPLDSEYMFQPEVEVPHLCDKETLRSITRPMTRSNEPEVAVAAAD